MAIAPLRVRFKGICCFNLDGKNSRVILVKARPKKKVKFKRKDDTDDVAEIDEHTAYIGVDDYNDIVVGNRTQIPDTKYFGSILKGETITIPVDSVDFDADLANVEHLKTGGNHFITFGDLIDLTSSNTAAVIPVPAALGKVRGLIDTDGNLETAFIDWLLNAKTNGDGNIEIERKLMDTQATEKFTVRPGTTVIIGNEATTSGSGTNHYFLYALLSKSTVKIDDDKRIVSFDCSNSQYP